MRGFALSALFLVHVMEAYELYWLRPDPDWSSKLIFTLFMGKSFPLMSIGFGFSCYMLIDRPGRDPSHTAGWFVWRLAILEVLGCLHALVYSGDIIEILATLGFPLLLATRIRGRRILAMLALVCFLQPLQLWDLALSMREGAAAVVPASGSDPEGYTYLHGGLLDVLRVNMWAGQVTKWSFMLTSGRICQIFGLYLVGLMLGRSNFFGRLEELRIGRRVALCACLAVAAVLHVSRAMVLDAMLDAGATVRTVALCRTLSEGWEDLAVTMVWGLSICALWQGPVRVLLAPLVNVGRATLSLYVLQSLVFVPLLYPFGAGLFVVWHGPARLLVGVVGIVLQIGIANLWFRHFRQGPLEWAWRSATDMRLDIRCASLRHSPDDPPNWNLSQATEESAARVADGSLLRIRLLGIRQFRKGLRLTRTPFRQPRIRSTQRL
ncbi:DUF418 domain-containing protein [Novosphingobium kaempferiae]|uniref:DUF418 domain-containing protein n=1 Tax=Novosphingobium kaempferiae TaxID=2896849 RepID=UPI001E350084|nr:DUF418 domain-containing protein [Novosphingobium kaempferiae]